MTENTQDGPLAWQANARCAAPEMIPYRAAFFSEDVEEVEDAKTVCSDCPVRKECLAWALNNKEIWGVWGGRDENEIRTALSLSEEGQEVRRIRDGEVPTCLYCGADTEKLVTGEIDLSGKGRWTTRKTVTCSECDFQWVSRTSANAVEAYLASKKR